MSTYLFPDFATNPDVYQQAVEYWAQLVRELESQLNQEGQWERWIPLDHADGTPIGPPGNPIFDGKSSSVDRAFRVDQRPPQLDREKASITAWLRTYDDEYDRDVFPAQELFVSLVLTQETAEVAKRLLKQWMSPETTSADMNSLIEQLGLS